MNTRILLVGENQNNFLIKALIKSLNQASYDVVFSPADARHIEGLRGLPDFPEFIILYLERIADSQNKFFPYMQKLLDTDKKIRIYFIGSMVEINQAYSYIDKSLVKFAFERPIDSKELLKILQRDGGDYALSGEVGEYDLDPDKKKILIIDDEILQLHAMKRWLQKSYNVFIAQAGTDGINILTKYKADMILLDYEMPVLSGYELFQLLKADPETADIPVVFLTANDDSDIVKQVVELHPAGYLLKSTAPMILLQKIDAIFKNLSKKKNEQENLEELSEA